MEISKLTFISHCPQQQKQDGVVSDAGESINFELEKSVPQCHKTAVNE